MRCWIALTALLLLSLFSSPSVAQEHPLGSAASGARPAVPEAHRAAEFVARAEEELHRDIHRWVQISWAFDTNITEHNEKKLLESKVEMEII